MHLNDLKRKIQKIWMGGNLPDEHILDSNNNVVKKVHFFRKWFIHPLKRRIAKYYLLILKNLFGLKVVAITGSSGKTTVKEMLTSILKTGAEVVSSYKNIDPIYNIPTTILKCSPATKYLILEMGVEYPGEMDFYLWLAKPDIALITNINPTHLEFFKNIDGVLKEKIKIAKNLESNDTLIINNEDNRLKNLKKGKFKIVRYGTGTDYFAVSVKSKNFLNSFVLNANGDKTEINLPTFGKLFISNSLAAACISDILGIPLGKIKDGLEKYTPPEHRMNIFTEKNGSLIIDDTYNNNPKAAEFALASFSELSQGFEKGIVFGDMLELGGKTEHYHRLIGKTLANMNLEFIIYIGRFHKYVEDEFKKKKGKTVFENALNSENGYKLLKKHLGKNKAILLKGSHSLGLDKIADKMLR